MRMIFVQNKYGRLIENDCETLNYKAIHQSNSSSVPDFKNMWIDDDDYVR